jgi:tight adherence protein B
MSRVRLFRVVSHVVLAFTLFALALIPQKRSSAADAPKPEPKFDVVAVIDSSSRTSRSDVLETQKKALVKYVKSLPANVRVAIVATGKFPTVIRDMSLSRDATTIAVTGIKAEGDAALYDGLVLAADQFDQVAGAKKQIVVLTDGKDQSSASTLDLVRTRLLTDAVRVDAIAFVTPDEDRKAIELLTSSTGGQIVQAVDLKAIVDLADRTAEWARPIVTVAPKQPSTLSKILGSTLLRFVLLGLVFAAILVAMLNVTAEGPEKLNLTGSAAEESAKKSSSTPVSGLAEKMTQVADNVMAKQGRDKGLNASLERAGSNLKSGEFLVMVLALGLGLTALCMLKFGRWGAFGGLLTPIFAKFYLSNRIKKRANAFGEQLSDTLQLLSSSLRAGQSMMQALDSVSREGDPPAAEEFRRVIVEARLGRDVVDAMRAMADRVQSEDFGWVVPAIEINREVGGDLAEVLDTVAKTIRDRADLRRQVKTLSAEGRFSAYVLLALPICITLVIRAGNPKYIEGLTHGTGIWLSVGGVVLMLLGAIWLFKICKIEF